MDTAEHTTASNSRQTILAALKNNQPELVPLPLDLAVRPAAAGKGESGVEEQKAQQALKQADLIDKFRQMAEGIGSKVYQVASLAEIQEQILTDFPAEKRMLSTVDSLVSPAIPVFEYHHSPHTYEDVEVAIFESQLAVAENSALWLSEDQLGIRVLPFITQHIIVIIQADYIVATMHDAYQKIAEHQYNYSTFIAGPSKTADIEQSLVLGAHGPRSMTIFIY